MRTLAFIVALMVSFAGSAAAQSWEVYTNVEDGFTVNFPGEPAVSDLTWTSRLNYTLPGRVYSATRGNERYSVTVVDYSHLEAQGIARAAACPPGNAQCRDAGDPIGPGYWQHDMRGALIYATNMLLQRDAKLEGLYWDWQDVVEGLSLTMINNADESVTFAYVAMHEKKLYIFEATVPAGYPEPGLFQQSVGWLDEEGNRIRYQGIVYSNSYHGMGVYPRPPYRIQGAATAQDEGVPTEGAAAQR